MQIDLKTGIEELQKLGFTHLESKIYVQLLSAGASSGYAIAQAISKPAANVYKAINTLEKKGAILVDEGRTRLCHAVPAEELLNALQQVFETNKKQVSQFLNSIEADEENDKVFRLKQAEQVYEKCRSLLTNATNFVVIDAFKVALEPLMDDIFAARQRGVKIAIHVYEPTKLPGVSVFYNPRGDDIQKRWKGLWLNLTIDGTQFIMAYFSEKLKKVDMAVWSNSPYISGVYHSALVAELQLSELKHKINDTDDIQEIRKQLDDMEAYFDLSLSTNSEFHRQEKKESN